MGFFKKKEKHVEEEEVRCPAEGCDIVFDDKWDLKRHIEWKHPELMDNDKKSALKTD